MRKRNRYVLLGLLLALAVPALVLIVAGKPASLHEAARDARLGWVRILATVKPGLLNSQDEWGRTPLHVAVHEGHADVVELLLAKGADTEIRDTLAGTPLHVAARRNQRRLAQALLASGADANAEGVHRRTPLHEAVLFNQDDVVELLLTRGVEVNARDRYGWSAFHYAATARGRSEICDLLIGNGAETDVFAATALGHPDEVRAYLDRDPTLLMAQASNGLGLMHLAGRFGHEALVELFLAEGVDVDLAGEGGATTLCYAVARCHEQTVRLLLAKGADVDGGSRAGGMPLLMACSNRCWGIAEQLLAHGAAVNVTDGWGATPLHHALRSGNAEVAKLLLAKGADVDATDFRGRTPLDWASGNEEMALLLKEHREAQQ